VDSVQQQLDETKQFMSGLNSKLDMLRENTGKTASQGLGAGRFLAPACLLLVHDVLEGQHASEGGRQR
jgi:hypothetical protein